MDASGHRVFGGYGLAILLVNALVVAWSGGAAAAGGTPRTVLALGDSLTAGYNLPAEAAFPVQLEEALRARGHAVRVVNGGVSGDTTAGGLARLDWVVGDRPPDVAIVELGANDALRGLDPGQAKANLAAVIETLQERGSRVLLAGMVAPPNLGTDYAAAFNGLYSALADRYGTALYPFFLDGVAARPALLQADGLHPTAEGVAEIVRRILPEVERLLAATPEAAP
jgi:acyl-CoA thioesterase-1